MSPPLVVIVAFRADDHLERCLHTLDRAKVVVVDNDNSRDTEHIVRNAGAQYVALTANVGFAAGVNAGLRATWNRLDDVLLLNPDALLTAANLKRLQAALHVKGARRAAVGPRLVGPAGEAQQSDWPIPSPGQVWFDAVGMGPRWRGPRFVVGAALLLSGTALAELGALDERFFLYAEEADWQRRALQAGWTVAVVDDVVVQHVGGASSSDDGTRSELFHGSGRAFAAKWFGASGRLLMRLGTVAAATRRGHQLRLPRPARASARESAVLVVRSDTFAGVERYVADVADELVTRGWRVHVIGGDPTRMLAELPIGATHQPGRTTAGLARALWRLGRCDVVHAHMTAAEVPAVLLRRRIADRVVVTRHFAAHRGSSVPGRLARRLVRRGIDEQISISRFVAQAIGEPSVVIPNGVRSTDHAEVGERERVVLVLQRLEPEKDTATAVRAWSASCLGEQGWRMIVHGRGSQRDQLRSLATELGVATTVDFAGHTDNPRALLASAAMLLATAPAEPFGLAVVEAMAEGTPVVAADSGAHPETMGDAGVYFGAGDATGAADALRRLASDPAERVERGRRLQQRQRTDFDLGTHVDRLVAVYRP